MTEKKIVTYLESDLEKRIFSGPASARTTFAIHVTGPFSSRECANIIAVLDLHKQWLLEDEAIANTKKGPGDDRHS